MYENWCTVYIGDATRTDAYARTLPSYLVVSQKYLYRPFLYQLLERKKPRYLRTVVLSPHGPLVGFNGRSSVVLDPMNCGRQNTNIKNSSIRMQIASV